MWPETQYIRIYVPTWRRGFDPSHVESVVDRAELGQVFSEYYYYYYY
jgi:hypothetical protein